MWPRFCSLLCRCGQFSGREPASLTRSPMANQRGQGASGSLATADWAGRGLESSALSRPRERKRSTSRLGWNDVSGLLLARRVFSYCMQLSGVSTSASSSHVPQNAIGRPPNLVFDILHVDEPEGERSLPDAMFSPQLLLPTPVGLGKWALLPNTSPSHLRQAGLAGSAGNNNRVRGLGYQDLTPRDASLCIIW